jgi:hypothetical protein
MRLIVILFAIAALVACDDWSRHGNRANIAFAPTETIGAQISPPVITLTTLATSTCATAVVLTSSFDLIVLATQGVDMFVDSVTFRLIDGSNLGGPSITFPSAQLSQMFGTTTVTQNRVFAFRPEFGCPVARPGSIAAEGILIDRAGKRQKFAASAVLR